MKIKELLNKENIKNKSGIYGIFCEKNNKIYIGQSKNILKRIYRHKYDLKKFKHPNNFLQNTWNKYGENALEFFAIEYCENRNEKEVYYSNMFNINNLFNLKKIGDIFETREETREKLRQINKGKKLSEETKEKIRKNSKFPFKGRKHTEETKRKISEKHKGKKLSGEHKKKLSENSSKHFLGKRHTKEALEKIGKASLGRKPNLGRKFSEEVRKKMSDGCKGRIVSEETRRKLSEAGKRRKDSKETIEKRKVTRKLNKELKLRLSLVVEKQDFFVDFAQNEMV